MYEGKRSAITNVVTIERALWHYDNTFFFTNQLEVDFGISHTPIHILETGNKLL